MRKFLATLTLLLLFIFLPTQSFATTIQGPAPHFINEDDIRISKEVNGETILIGTNISVDAPINGDVLIIGDNVSIAAPINGDLRVVGSQTEIESQVSGSFAFISEKVVITSVGEVSKDAYGISQGFSLYGRVGGDLNLGYAKDANILIDGNVAGNIHYLNSIPNLTDKSFLGGKLVQTDTSKVEENEEFMRLKVIIGKIIHSLSLILMGLLIINFFPKIFEKGLNSYTKNISQNLLYGLLSLVLIPLVIILLLASVIAAPIALVITGIVIFLIYIAPLYPAMFIGKKLLPNAKGVLIQLICGIFIFDVISMGPYIGSILYMFSIITFLGLVLKFLLGLRGKKISK